MEDKRKELEKLESEINQITSENIQLEQKYREGVDANFQLIKNRDKLVKLMNEFCGR